MSAAFRIQTTNGSLMVDDVEAEFPTTNDLLEAIRGGWWTGRRLMYVWREWPTGPTEAFTALINPDHVVAIHDLRDDR